MKTFKLPTVLAGVLLAAGVASVSTACVADRPSRNGVFNENQYVRKDFLIQGTDTNGVSTGEDPGWMVRATVTETSTPNLLGSAIGIFGGASADVNYVRFRVTQDKLQLLNRMQLSSPQAPGADGQPGPSDTTGVTDDVMNAWPATNVDLKYRVNLDGEKTNFYEENQELDWQVRQWVKLQFDKNDFSDLAPLGVQVNDLLGTCGDMTDSSTTLVANSFNIEGDGDNDPSNDYFEFTVQVSIPMTLTDAPGTNTCIAAYGPILASAAKINRFDVTLNLKYSFMRAKPLTAPQGQTAVSYPLFELDEKDPIHTKYGPFLWTVWNRDNQSGLLAANQYVGRFDPQKPIVFYFEQGFPEYYKGMFWGAAAGGAAMPNIQDGTNAVLTTSGAAARVQFLNYNDASSPGDGKGPSRNYGDVRYNMLRWLSDQDIQDSFAGATMPGFDPRTGEIVNENISFNDFAFKDYYAQRIDAFLQTIGASGGLGSQNCTGGATTGCWLSGPCQAGQKNPIVNATVVSNHNASDTLYTKMQTYLDLNPSQPATMGPQDFVAVQDADFFNAYFQLAPYQLFADPDMNQFVTREGGAGVYGPAAVRQALNADYQFQQLAAQINNGQTPYDTTGGPAAAANFVNAMRDGTTAHQQLQLMKQVIRGSARYDVPGSFSLETVMAQDAQQCVNGNWESQTAWIQGISDVYWQQVFWHEFGHAMGLEHNFMGNIDQLNFQTQRDAKGNVLTDSNGNTLYKMYSSSIMEYSANPTRLEWVPGWGTYDAGAIAWIYANCPTQGSACKQADNTTLDAKAAAALSRSGELLGATQGKEYPFADPLGFCVAGDPDCQQGTQRQFLRCDATHEKYSPMCREGDLGVTPSQIIANSIDTYEWQYQWRNFRDYRKVWDESAYANAVVGAVVDQRRFLSQWAFDWSPGELATTLYRIGVKPPSTAPSAVDYYAQLTHKFLTEMSKANRMVAAFDEAIIQQAAGERPYATVYDKFYGDVTQQGIILDKYFAMQDFVALWTSDNYDQNQAGAYISSWGGFDFDDSYTSIAETAVSSMIGSQYAVYPYFIPAAVTLFAQDTHNPAFLSGAGRTEAKDWIGGWQFVRQQDLIDFFRQLAVNANYQLTDPFTNNVIVDCSSWDSCQYDPTNPEIVQQNPVTKQFLAPDGLNYVYAYINSLNEWVLAREDRNIVMWKLILQYNTDVFGNLDDGSNGTYGLEYPIKYTINSYQFFEQGGSATPTTSTSSGN